MNEKDCCNQEYRGETQVSNGIKSYVGTKIIKAVQMNDIDFERERILFDESRFNVEHYKKGGFIGNARWLDGICSDSIRTPKAGYKVIYPDGYISWSPLHVFEQCYREISEAEKKII